MPYCNEPIFHFVSVGIDGGKRSEIRTDQGSTVPIIQKIDDQDLIESK
jgi:hypothetical protein